MSLDRTVAWVINQGTPYFSPYSDVFGDAGIQVRPFHHAAPAIAELTQTRYGCVVSDLDIAPGENHGDPEMDRIMARPDLQLGGLFVGYPYIALYMIRRLREPASANRETPIIVASVYHPLTDTLLPQAGGTCETAGANAYVDLRRTDLDSFVRLVENSLRR